MKDIILFFGLFFLLFSAYSKGNKDCIDFHYSVNQIIHDTIDTSIIAILPIKSAKIFEKDEDPQPLNLTENDLTKVETILITCIKTRTINPHAHYDTLNLDNYKRQYIPYILNGEKKVYVNCFSRFIKDFPNWRKYFVAVDGGGSAFFSITINLTTEKCSPLWVNAQL